MLLQLEKTAVEIEQIGGPQVRPVDQFALGMAQNFLQISRH